MAAGDPLQHLSAEQRRRGSLRLLRALFPDRFVEQPSDGSADGPDGDEAADFVTTAASNGRS